MNIEKVVVIIPTYNEAPVIKETIVKVFQETENIVGKVVHILIFDSNSADDTQQIVTQLQRSHPRLHLQFESEKSGLGSAYLQAMRYALDVLSADIVMEFDADLSHQPKYIAPMLEKLKQYDVVVGSRYVKGGSIPKQWGWHRKLLSVVGNYVARVVLTWQYKDMTSGFRAIKHITLKHTLPERFLSNNYAYKIHLMWLLHKSRANIYEFPIEFVDRQKGNSKLPANSIIDSLRVLFKLRFVEIIRFFKT